MTRLAILDLGYGNTDSIRLAFARLGVEAMLTADAEVAEAVERLVLPGVGAAGFAMQRLSESGLVEPLRRRTGPTLGICLGMQLMFEHSDEGDTACLGLVPGRVRVLSPAPGRPVPHMGWTAIHRTDAGLGLRAGDYVYFAHGFACDDGPATAATANYGRAIPAALRQGPLWGAQFHPERSSAAGARFLEAFLAA
ncbi:MAG: imidazole glycerol phosphate synthase subunit HisH [Pseudomonadota bacterium]|nr:imidazole glycerol phosphate synthase subunit HisH [Pseudomonadota bacterium]